MSSVFLTWSYANLFVQPKKTARGLKFMNKRVLLLVREPAILLIKWLSPKGLKMYSYVEKYAEFKNQTLKKNRLVHKSAMRDGIPPG